MKYIVVLLCLTGFSLARKLPSFIEVCKPKHTDVSKCILKNIENLRPKLREEEGVAEMALPSLNPLVIPLAVMEVGDFKATLKNITLWRLDEFVVNYLNVDLEKIIIDLNIKFPVINAVSDYSVNGKLLVLTLDGHGRSQINITNLEANVHAIGQRDNRNGKEYVAIKTMEIKPKVGHLNLFFENLFPNNKELTDNANNILNENQNIIIEDYSPIVTNIIKEFLNKAISNIFDHYTIDVLFPED